MLTSPRRTSNPPTNTTADVPTTVIVPTTEEKIASRVLRTTRARMASFAAPENRCPSYGSRAKLFTSRMAAKLSCSRAVMRDSSTRVRSAPGRIRRADHLIQTNMKGTTDRDTRARGALHLEEDPEHHDQGQGRKRERQHASQEQLFQASGVSLEAVHRFADWSPRMVAQVERLQVRKQTLAQIPRDAVSGLAIQACVQHQHCLVCHLDQ